MATIIVHPNTEDKDIGTYCITFKTTKSKRSEYYQKKKKQTIRRMCSSTSYA